ncbi:Na+/H+ antiporter subunit E [Pseudonocardia kujensis]|nr:Na+/H+ antiporter subunit E [Pseudonocardia kujensis]
MSTPELLAAAVCALPCAVVALRARRALGARWRVPRAVLRWAPAVALGAVTDTVRVLLAGTAGGRVREVVLDEVGARGSAAQDTYRALATVAVAATPGSVVLDERGGRRLVVHALGTGRPDVSRVVRS